MDTETFIQLLPKAETHLHLEGAAAWDMVRRYASEDLPETPEWWEAGYRFQDFSEFESAMHSVIVVLKSPERYREAAAGLFDLLIQQNVRYVEVSFAADLVNRWGSIGEVTAAIHEAARPELIVRVIGGINRYQPVTPGVGALAAALLSTPGLDGIDLHGDERNQQTKQFAELFAAAAQQGYITRAHAGELLGVDSVKEALDLLHVKRIEHGTTSIQDDELIQRLVDEQIVLDMCPTSNVKLRVVNSYEEHPIGALLRRGVPVTVSTDDPTIFGCALQDELRTLVKHQGFTPRDLAQLQINAFEAAALSAAQRQALITEIETLLTA